MFKPLFGEDKSHSIAIEFNDKSKIIILDLAHKYIPEPEFCNSLWYLNDKYETILEQPAVGFTASEGISFLGISILPPSGGNIYVDSSTVKDIQLFNNFCKQLEISSYTTILT